MTIVKPKIISVLQQKGGSGKTTISTNLTHALIMAGIKTLLGDADPQGSSRKWHEANNAQLVPCIGLDRETIAADLKAISSGYQVVVIDGAPGISKLLGAAIRVSDVILIPVQPSPYDVDATYDLVEFIKTRREITDGKPEAAFIISRAIKNTIVSNAVLDMLADYNLPILTNRTTQHVAYVQTVSLGQSVFSEPTSPAAREFQLLANEIILKYINV